MRKLSVFLTLCVLSLAMPTKSDAQNQFSLRLGLSTLSGFAGGEYQMGNVSLMGGWFGSQDTGEESGTCLVGGVRYSLKPDGSTPYIGASIVTNQSGVSYGKLGHYLDIAAGYKFQLGSKFDMTIGAGVAPKISGEGDMKGAADLTIGYRL